MAMRGVSIVAPCVESFEVVRLSIASDGETGNVFACRRADAPTRHPWQGVGARVAQNDAAATGGGTTDIDILIGGHHGGACWLALRGLGSVPRHTSTCPQCGQWVMEVGWPARRS